MVLGLALCLPLLHLLYCPAHFEFLRYRELTRSPAPLVEQTDHHQREGDWDAIGSLAWISTDKNSPKI